MRGHRSNLYHVAFSPDGTRIATAGRNTIRLWDRDSLEEVVSLREHTSFVWSVAFSMDGNQLASASGDRTVRIWDTRTSRDIAMIRVARDRIRSQLRPELEIARERPGGLARFYEGLKLREGGSSLTLQVARQLVLAQRAAAESSQSKSRR